MPNWREPFAFGSLIARSVASYFTVFDKKRGPMPTELQVWDQAPSVVLRENLHHGPPLAGDLVGGPAMVVIKGNYHSVFQSRKQKLKN
jgi:hypothetical protein